MKPTTLLISFILLCSMAASASEGVFEAQAVSYGNEDLDRTFAAYTVVQVNFQSIDEFAKSHQEEPFDLDLQFSDGRVWMFTLLLNDIRSEDYRLIASNEFGASEQPRKPAITYAGMERAQPDKEIRISITPSGIMGFTYEKDAAIFFEPASLLVAGAPANYLVIYHGNDVLVDAEVTCGKKMLEQHAAPIHEDMQPQPLDEERSTLNCIEVDFALAAAYDLYVKFGSNVDNVENHLLTITSMMEPLYDDFDLDYIVRTIFVPTSSGGDPFPTTADVDVILPAFAAWGPAGFAATHDVGQLWVARDIFGCGSGTGLIGCANIGVVCNSGRYNVCEDWSSSYNCLRSLSAHEIGHNWDGVHSQATSSAHIMWPTIGCNNTTWASGNITRINNHINSRTCLVNCATACPFAYSIQDYIISGTWEYEALWFITGTGHVEASAVVIFDAGISVTLAEGFEASPSTGYFLARTDGCGGLLAAPEDVEVASAKIDIEETPQLAAMNMKVYPNPVDDNLTIELELVRPDDVIIVVHDAVGREVLKIEESAVQESLRMIKRIEVSDLPGGSYFVTAIANDQQMVRKIVKLR